MQKKYVAMIVLCMAISLCACSVERSSTVQNSELGSTNIPESQEDSKYGESFFQLLDLTTGDTKEHVTELYGEPESETVWTEGDGTLLPRRQMTRMNYKDKAITVQRYMDDEEETYRNGVVEVEVFGGDYETQDGIKVGDSLEKVTETYDIPKVFDYGTRDDEVSSVIWERAEHAERYADSEAVYDYGMIDQIASVTSNERFERYLNVPALVFLIKDGCVSRMILMNLEI